MDLEKLFSFVLLIFGFSLLFLGIITFSNKNKNISKIIFGFLTFCAGWWSISYFFWMNAASYKVASFWVGMLNFGSTFIPVIYYHWIITLIDKKRKIILIIGYTFSFIFSLFSFSDFYFTELHSIAGFRFWPKAGVLYIYYIFLIYLLFYFLGILELINFIFKTNDEKQRKKCKLILIAFIVSLGAGMTNFPLWFGINILPYGNFCLIFGFIFLVIYSIYKYNLMDMKFLRIQIILGLVLVVSFVEIFFANSLNEIVFHIFNFLFFLFFSFLLIKSSKEDLKQNEHLRQVSGHLNKAIESLKLTNKKLKELDKAKNEFLSVAAHQLRTPATAVKGYTAMILDGNFGKCDPEVIIAIKKVYQANERMTILVEDLLNTSRIESGHLKYEFTKVNIQEILKELEYTFIIRAKDKKIAFRINYPTEAIPEIIADRNKIREVISNIIDNAVKYTIEGSVRVFLSKEEDFIQISVEDTGRGMAEKTLKHLFEKFTRGEESSAEVEGTGLGLFIVRAIVEKHQGSITAFSEGLGKGSKFVLKLPIEMKPDNLEKENEKEEKETEELLKESEKIINAGFY